MKTNQPINKLTRQETRQDTTQETRQETTHGTCQQAISSNQLRKLSILKPFILAFMLCITMAITGCGKKVSVDYKDAKSFETALNNGEDLTGKTVTFTADELEPQSAFGYNIFAGEHLNFVSQENPNIKVGEEITVKVTKVESLMGSWIISYEKV